MIKRDVRLTRLCMIVSTLCLALGIGEIARHVFGRPHPHLSATVEFIVFTVAFLGLFYGNLVYQLTRLGRLSREDSLGRHITPEETRRIPRVAVLIPSYKEELHVVLQTVLSAALARYPAKTVTVLLDDPPKGTIDDIAARDRTVEMLAQLDAFFADERRSFERARSEFEMRRGQTLDPIEECRRLAAQCERAADIIDGLGARYMNHSGALFAHADKLFLESVIGRVAADHRECAQALRAASAIETEALAAIYDLLAGVFAVPISSFERKRFVNLSHAANKAMNLNSYIGIMGRRLRIQTEADGGQHLVPVDDAPVDLEIPTADYVLTIDADSIILPDYVEKLVRVMEADRRIAIAQTPYSAYPDAPSSLERIAGATTDIQYFVHQGFTACDATFWVGANALLRTAALEQIRTIEIERGYRVPVFIQDKTVIEDTGSTIDLVRLGWRLHNHPERLAYSATPPDFGALVIQRRRWANGGLIIFADLVRLAFQPGHKRMTPSEFLVRSHYLLSPTLASFCLLVLLLYPFGANYSNVWIALSVAPYYLLYGRDLKQAGYSMRELVSVYALTLLLVPVNLAGVLRSLQQICTGRKSAFGRTPKVGHRTAVPAIHLVFLLALVPLAAYGSFTNLLKADYLFAAFSIINGAFILFALSTLVGWRALFVDLLRPLGVVVSDEDPLLPLPSMILRRRAPRISGEPG